MLSRLRPVLLCSEMPLLLLLCEIPPELALLRGKTVSVIGSACTKAHLARRGHWRTSSHSTAGPGPARTATGVSDGGRGDEERGGAGKDGFTHGSQSPVKAGELAFITIAVPGRIMNFPAIGLAGDIDGTQVRFSPIPDVGHPDPNWTH